jgi:hypothetical protein
MKSDRATLLLPVPVEPEIKTLLKEACAKTRLKQADVIRTALRLGLPQLVKRFDGVRRPRRNFADYIGVFDGVVTRNREMVKPSRVK